MVSSHKQAVQQKVYGNKNWYVLLVLLAVLLYGWTYTFGWGLDDLEFIYNPIWKIENNWHGISTLLAEKYGQYDYRPVTLFTFWVEKRCFGDIIPSYSHLINAILYGVLIVQIFRFILKAEFYDNKKKLFALALLTSILFLVHPSHVSVVANIKSRDNILSCLFGISALIQSVNYFNDRKWWRILLFLLLIISALFSKVDAFSFGVIAVVYFLMYKFKWEEGVKTQSKILLKYFLLFSSIYVLTMILMALFQNSFVESSPEYRYYLDSPLVENDSFLNRISLSLTTLFYYLKFMIIPHGYYFYFGINQVPLTSLFSIVNVVSFVIYISLFLFSIKKYRENKLYLFSFLFFMLTIGYAANFFRIVSGILMDRYSFIASLGFCLGLSTLIIDKLKITDWKVVLDKKIIILFLVLISATIYRTTAWKDIETLFHRDIAALYNSAHAQAVMGGLYIRKGLFDNLSKEESDTMMKIGEKYINKSIEINPKNKFGLESKGICRTYFGDDETAKYYLHKAIQVDSAYTGPYNNLGIAYRNLNELDSAILYFGIAMNKDEMFSYPANNYIDMLIRKERYSAIDSTFNVLVSRFPNDNYLANKIYEWKTQKVWKPY